jgi:diguanylate cyclase (GGDEF)-like protein
MQLNLLVMSYLASAAVSGAVFVAVWRRRSVVGARGLALLMVAVAWWLLANAFEASSLDRSAKIAWSVVAYVGILSTPVLYLLFVLEWTRQDASITRFRIALLFVLPAVSLAIAATNEWHHLLWPSVTLIDAWGVTAVYSHGPWFWVEILYGYALVGAGLLAIVIAMYRYPAGYSTRMRIAIVASLIPIVASVVYAAGLDASLHADLSSISFAGAGMIAAWAVLRGGLLELAPVAWTTLVDTLADAVLVLDPDRRIAAFNPSAARLLGVAGAALRRPVDEVLAGFDELAAACRRPGEREVVVRRADRTSAVTVDAAGADAVGAETAVESNQLEGSGDGRWVNVRVTAIGDRRGRDLGFLIVMRDVTDRRRAVDEIRRLSHTDELTGLLNRRGFANLAEQQMRTALRTRHRLWLVFADLDDLKSINDRLGHDAGDRALCVVGELLKAALFRKADIVARLGGDEFAILATEISRSDGETLGRRLTNALAEVNDAPGRECPLSLSIGVALFDPDQPVTLDELIHTADGRMYEAKHARQLAAGAPREPAADSQAGLA